MNSVLRRKLIKCAHHADVNSNSTTMSECVKEVLKSIDKSKKDVRAAHGELITLYKSIESVGQPRLLSHIIMIGKMLENSLED